jgi:hypothetical protein
VIEQLGGLGITEFAAECLEVGQPRITEDSGLPVDDRLAHLQLRRSVGDRRKLLGPVVSAAGIDGDFSIPNMDLSPVAIGLDLVNPLASGRRPLLQRGVAWLNEPRHGCLTPGSHPREAATRRSLQRPVTHDDSIGARAAGSRNSAARRALSLR